MGQNTGHRRRNNDQDAVAPVIGASDADRHSKFARAASSVLSAVDTLGSTATSLSGEFGRTLKPTDYVVPTKTGPKGAGSSVSSAPSHRFIAKSMYTGSFPDFVQEALSLKAHSEEEYRAAFERVDVDGSGFITLDEVADLLRTVLGSEPTDFQVKSFFGYFDGNADGKISWDEFRSGLGGVSEAMLTTTRIAAAPCAGAAHLRKGVPAVIRDPAAAPMSFSESKDLFAGTSKASSHLPGYSGHIAESTFGRSGAAALQSTTLTQKDSFLTHTNLDLTTNHRVPGYTGHIPKASAVPVLSASTTLSAAPTERSAADAMVSRFWESRRG